MLAEARHHPARSSHPEEHLTGHPLRASMRSSSSTLWATYPARVCWFKPDRLALALDAHHAQVYLFRVQFQ